MLLFSGNGTDMIWNLTFAAPTDPEDLGAGYVITVVENSLKCMNSTCSQDVGDIYQAERIRVADAVDLTTNFTLSYIGAYEWGFVQYYFLHHFAY